MNAPKPIDPLRAEILAALRTTDKGHPLRVAVGKLLDDNVALLTLESAAAGQSSEARHYLAGQLAGGIFLQGLWEECGEEAERMSRE